MHHPLVPLRADLSDDETLQQQAAEAWHIHGARQDEPEQVGDEVEVLWAGWFDHRRAVRPAGSVPSDEPIPLVVMRSKDLLGAVALDSTDLADAEAWWTWELLT